MFWCLITRDVSFFLDKSLKVPTAVSREDFGDTVHLRQREVSSILDEFNSDSFLFGPQKSQIYTWDGRQSDRWTKLDLKTELPRDTLLSVEIVHELKGEVGSHSFLYKGHCLPALPFLASITW